MDIETRKPTVNDRGTDGNDSRGIFLMPCFLQLAEPHNKKKLDFTAKRKAGFFQLPHAR
ncbi:hypothetical protein [Chitinophaga sp. XS-30]|uniref:hypothetical protein n=1 Tax=Chitinophaga sp. XS-30 TaxID=2604421 RepID=UPI00143D5301|nr:hypothetical protein [Chitinophaga sp. XS-30]